MARCRLCTSNDNDAVIEHLAAALWRSRQGAFEYETPWERAGSWQEVFREFAIAAQQALTVE